MAFLLFTPFLAFSTLCPAGSARAAESPAITWPARWKVFLPVERDAPILEGKELVRIPETLEFSGRVIRGVWAAPDPVGEIREKEIELKNVMLDLAPLFGEIVVGNTAWVFLPIEAENAGRARLGMGADWWMQAWLNGQRILDTTAGGNIAWPIMIDNHIVDVDVEAGTNVLAVRFVGGANSATLAVGGPVHLAEVDRVMDELAVAPRVEDLRPTPGWAERFRRDVDFPSLTRIPLGVDWADNEVSRAAVTFGVPFPRGLLFDTDNLRLVCDAGSPTPADFRVTATWDGPDGPARWVLVSATLDKGRGYFLEAGTDVSRADSAGIVLRETEDFIEVDTGAARVIIDRRVPSLAHTVALASGKALVNASRSAGELPRVVDGDGNVYRAGGSEHGLEVSVVERGARRATVRREGWYVDEAGARFCGFVTYTYFHAGQAGFRHDHTLIVAFDSNAHRIRDIQLPLPLELRSDGRAFFAGDDVYMSRGILLYYQLTGEARMRELFLANMEQCNRQRHLHVLSGDSRSTTIAGLAHAFFLTGEKDFLPFMLWQLELALDRVPVEGEAGEIGAAPWTFEHPYMSTLGWQLPVAMAVLAEAADLPAPDRFPAGVAHPLRIRFSRAFYLLQENDGPLDLDVSVHLYPPYASEMAARVGNFNNGHEWGGALPEDERPALIVTGPDGHEKGRFDLDPAAINHEVNVRLPADGLTGTYVLTLHAPALPAEVRLTASSVDRVVVPDGEHRLRGTATYYFLVPAGTGLFRVGTKSSLVRGQESVVIRDPSGEILAEDSREVGGVPHNRWLYLEADAGQPVEDRIYQVHFIGPGNPGRFFRMEGVPGFLASSPGEPFTPDRRAPEPPVLLPERPERFGFSDAGLPWGGPAAWLPADGSLTIPAPANGQALLNPDEGVVELWVRPAEACSNLADRIFLRAGDFRLYRRYDIGVYQHAGGARTMRDLILPPNRWTHLAVMWRGVEDGRLETALFVDGVRVGAPTTVRPSDGWHRGDLVIPQGPGGLFVSGLRVSGTARYAENFPRPWSPPEADAQTRVLAVFDGEWKAVVLGEPVPVLTRGAP